MLLRTRIPLSSTLRISCACIIGLCTATSAGSGGEPDFDLAEAKAQWTEARALASAVNGTIQFKTAYLVKVDPSAADTEGRLEVRQKKGCALTHGTNPAAPAGKGAEQLTGVNPKYAFQIHRAAESSDWVLDSIDVGGDGSRLPFVSPLTQSEKARAAVCDNFQLERPLTLERLFGMPNLRITRSTIVTLDSVEMVRIEFTCLPSPEKPKDRLSVILGGHLILDPRHYWCIKECSYRTDDSMSKRTFLSQFEYTEGREHFPLLRRATTKQEGFHPDGTVWFTTQTNVIFDLRENSEYDDSDFTLAKYGLPEPVGATWKKPTPTYVWLLIGAGAFAALAFGLRWLGRRSSRTAEGT